jgi:ABC-2 type transport system ATP-binding protein
MTVLEANDLGKRYGKVWGLRNCSLAIERGRVVGLVGPNGAGKTTLLHLAVGLTAPTTGMVTVFGQTPRNKPRLMEKVGFVAQETPLYPELTVAETLTLGRRLNRIWDEEWAAARASELRLPRSKRVGELSGGHRAQIALTLAVGKRPELLLLDEPVASLDPLARREFLQLLMDTVSTSELTVVLSSHLISDLERVCDYLILLMEAEVRLAGDIDALLASHKLLVGPRSSTVGIAGVDRVVQVSHTERQTTLLVQSQGGVVDPRWVASEIDLEQLVLGYMGQSLTAAAPLANGTEISA